MSNCDDRRVCLRASLSSTPLRGSGLATGILAFSWISDNHLADSRKISAFTRVTIYLQVPDQRPAFSRRRLTVQTLTNFHLSQLTSSRPAPHRFYWNIVSRQWDITFLLLLLKLANEQMQPRSQGLSSYRLTLGTRLEQMQIWTIVKRVFPLYLLTVAIVRII